MMRVVSDVFSECYGDEARDEKAVVYVEEVDVW